MQTKHRKLNLNLSWNRIPRRRRHAYIYVLFLLCAVVGNDICRSVASPSEEIATSNPPSRVENLKAKTNLLYR
ncbi:MAG TPA: hypothetical protein VJS65_12830 [Verrucomicrobiae bacterium]|nr:hypothetical protein [Verrucomicrobiae bacterium]